MSERLSARASVKTLMRERQFRLLFTSQALSAAGSALIPVTMAISVLHVGGSLGDLSLVLGAGSGTQLAMLLIGGVWADRLPRGTVMWLVNAGRGALSLAFGIAFLCGQVRIWQFVALSVLAELGDSIYIPATKGLVKETVPAGLLQQADAMMSFCWKSTNLLGPAIAGVLLALGNPGIAYVIDGLTFVMASALMSRMRVPKRTPEPRQQFKKELAQGWHEVRSHRWFWQTLIAHGFWNMGFSALFVLGPAVAVEALDGARDWASISTALAVGSVLGAIVALRVRVRRPLVIGGLALLPGAAPLVALALHANLVIDILAAAVAMMGLSVVGSLWNSAVMQLVPAERIARVSSFDHFVSFSIMPLTYVLVPLVSSSFGVRATLIVCGFVVFAPATLTLLSRSIHDIYCDEAGLVTAGRPVSSTGDFGVTEVATGDASSA